MACRTISVQTLGVLDVRYTTHATIAGAERYALSMEKASLNEAVLAVLSWLDCNSYYSRKQKKHVFSVHWQLCNQFRTLSLT